MKRKSIKYLTLSGCIIGTLLLAGCGQTEEKVTVSTKEETENSNAQVQSDDEVSLEVIRTTLNAPDHFTDEVSDKTGNIKVNIDADIVIPEVKNIPSYQVTEKEVDDVFVQKFADVFLEEAAIYNMEDYVQPTKKELEAKIKTYKNELDTKDYDTEKLGDINGEKIDEETYRKQLQNVIDSLQEQVGKAPDEIACENVIPKISNADEYGNYYIVVQDDGTSFDYQVQDFNGIQMNIRREVQDVASSDSIWGEYQPSKDSGYLEVTEKEMQNMVGITYEEAKKIADKKVQDLGLDYLRVYDWDYAYLRDGNIDTHTPMIKKAGYQFYYTRYMKDIPITYTIASGGGLPEMDSDMETWNYEQMGILITEDGIEEVNFACPYELDESKIESNDLMQFDEIMDIFENMMLVENIDILDYENWRTYTINRITLGYTRVYDPKADAKSGKLVPVWDFFGGIDCESEWDGKNIQNKNFDKTQSHMTINAMDGSVIDRELGY